MLRPEIGTVRQECKGTSFELSLSPKAVGVSEFDIYFMD
jgi:hypothetical protein